MIRPFEDTRLSKIANAPYDPECDFEHLTDKSSLYAAQNVYNWGTKFCPFSSYDQLFSRYKIENWKCTEMPQNYLQNFTAVYTKYLPLIPIYFAHFTI